jgi:pyrroloquinoline quinone (PQQ) biosynthesis protein C
MNETEFKEALLGVMERKVHWAWPDFEAGRVPAERLHIHLEQEFATYVRDFPILLGRAFVICDVPAARRELIENAYEEETGGLAAGRPHPELFLMIPKALGMDLSRFAAVELIPEAAAYRRFLDECTLSGPWSVAAAVTTLFLEGTRYERGEIDETAPKRPVTKLEDHPLVKHYGLPVDALALVKAHRQVEGNHRASAWRVLLASVPARDREPVVRALLRTLELWLVYRDGVAREVGLSAPKDA